MKGLRRLAIWLALVIAVIFLVAMVCFGICQPENADDLAAARDGLLKRKRAASTL